MVKANCSLAMHTGAYEECSLPVSAEIEYEGPQAPKGRLAIIDRDVQKSYDYVTRLLERY
jgi:hypothetical protein